MGQGLLPNGASQATPASGYVAYYTRTTDKRLYTKDDAGAELKITGTSAALTDGQLIVGQTGVDPLAKTMSGDATFSATGAITIGANAVTNAKLAQMAANTIKGNNTGGTANALDLTVAQVVAMLQGNYTSMITFNGLTLAGNNTYYSMPPTGWQTTDANQASSPVPFSCTISKLYVDASSAPGAGQTFILTLQKNEGDTALTVTISGTNKTGNDSANSVSLVAGDRIQMKLVTSLAAAASDVKASVKVAS